MNIYDKTNIINLTDHILTLQSYSSMNNPTQHIERRVDFAKWFFSVFSWDGLLPLFVLGLPYLIDFIPNIQDATVSLILVFSVIIIFLIRIIIGIGIILKNSCGKTMKTRQYRLFTIGVVYMLVVDAMVCTRAFFPQGIMLKDIISIILLIMPYLFLMTIAMYPGKTTYTYEEKDYLDKDWAE